MINKKRKSKAILLIIFCAVVLAFLLALILPFRSTNTAAANMGPPPPLGENSGIVFERHDTIAVRSQTLDINFSSDNDAVITATYTMVNTSNQAITVQSMFLAPSYGRTGARDFSVKVNGVSQSYERQFFAYSDRQLTASDLLNWREILAKGEGNSGGWGASINAVLFDISFAPGQVLEVIVIYNYTASSDGYRALNRFRLRYLLTPASYWESTGDLRINISLQRGHIMHSTLPFFGHGGSYSIRTQQLPTRELQFAYSTMPRGLAFIRFGTLGMFVAPIVLLSLLFLALIACHTLLVVKVSKKTLDRRSFVYWLLFTIFLTASLALSFVTIMMAALEGIWMVILFAPSAFLFFVPAMSFMGVAIGRTVRIKKQQRNYRDYYNNFCPPPSPENP